MLPFVSIALFGGLIVANRAVRENEAASSQQTSFGMITDCRSHRSQNYCSYTFPVDGEQYLGNGPADTEIHFGERVLVYYDSRDPSMNGLEDFSQRGRKDKDFVYILLLVVGAFTAFVIYSIATEGSNGD